MKHLDGKMKMEYAIVRFHPTRTAIVYVSIANQHLSCIFLYC